MKSSIVLWVSLFWEGFPYRRVSSHGPWPDLGAAVNGREILRPKNNIAQTGNYNNFLVKVEHISDGMLFTIIGRDERRA